MASSLVFVAPPGSAFIYGDYNTILAGMILERTTHRTVSEYMQEKIWQPLGMEYPATRSIDSEEDGLELTASALNARAIDYPKFGSLYLHEGARNGHQIGLWNWVIESTTRDPNDHRSWLN
jgi:CubicO group peptidase (beta-lactamase class C family)